MVVKLIQVISEIMTQEEIDKLLGKLQQDSIMNDNKLENLKKVLIAKQESKSDLANMFLLYISDMINMDVLKNFIKNNKMGPEEQMEALVAITKELKGLNCNLEAKIEDLLLNFLNYDDTQKYLNKLLQDGIIDKTQLDNINQVINNYKIEELENYADSQPFGENSGGKEILSCQHIPNIIDPEIRINFLKELGATKYIWIKAEGESQSLEGYQLIIIPKLGVSVLEKFYKTTRDKKNNIQNRLNERGQMIPEINNATYILPGIIAKELIETSSKKKLLQKEKVRRVFHTANWGNELINKIIAVNSNAKEQINLDADNIRDWINFIAKNYLENSGPNI